MRWGILRSIKHLLEDFIELWLLDLSVSWVVDSFDELIDLGLTDLSVGVDVLQGIPNEVEDLTGIETVAVVNVVLAEDGIDSSSELLVTVWHILK